MTILGKSKVILLALVMSAYGTSASANRAKPTKNNQRQAVAKKKPARQAVRKPKPKAGALQRKVTARRTKPAQVRKAPARAKAPAKKKANPNAKPKTTRFTIRNPGSLVWVYQGNDKGNPSKDARRQSFGLDPFGTSQTLRETELQASLDLSKYDSAVKAIQAIAKDPKKTSALLGGKKGWSLVVKPKKQGTLKMTDYYADNPQTFALSKVGSTARWRSVQRLDAQGKPVDDRQQLNVKAGFRMLPNGVVVRVEQGAEVAGLVKNGRIADPRLKKFLSNHRLEDNPTNLIKQLLPNADVVKLVDTPLLVVSQTRYKFHIRDNTGADVGEGSIDIVEAKPTAAAKKLFGKQLKSNVRFGRVEYEGEHVNPTLSQRQMSMAQNSSRPHGAFDVYSNTLTQSGDIKTLTGIAGRLTKALGAQQAQGNKVFESMSRLGFFDHLPGGAQHILDAQQKNQAKWLKQIKKANPGFVD